MFPDDNLFGSVMSLQDRLKNDLSLKKPDIYSLKAHREMKSDPQTCDEGGEEASSTGPLMKPRDVP